LKKKKENFYTLFYPLYPLYDLLLRTIITIIISPKIGSR